MTTERYSQIIEFPIAREYVSDWTTTDALRELVQNTLDEQDRLREDQSLKHDVRYIAKNRVALFMNEGTRIDAADFVLGESSKNNAAGPSRGKFGEGFKLAVVVLLRNGYSIVLRSQDTLWRFSFDHSDTYGREVLAISKSRLESSFDGVAWAVFGITPETWSIFAERVRRLQKPSEVIAAGANAVLMDESQRGKIYVGGLLVRKMEREYAFGYDFAPSAVTIDRDRKMVSEFELKWATSRILTEVGIDAASTMAEAYRKKVDDFEYAFDNAQHSEVKTYIADSIFEQLIEEHGDRFVAVSCEAEAAAARSTRRGCKPVIVSDKIKKAVENSPKYREHLDAMQYSQPEQPFEAMGRFLENWKHMMAPVLQEAFVEMTEKSKYWGTK